MFAVRDGRTGKYLKAFNGSYNNAHFYVGHRLRQQFGRQVTAEEVHAAEYCLDTPEGSQVYKTRAAVAAALGGHRRKDEKTGRMVKVPLAEALPWLEIVPVKVVLA